VKNLKLFGNSQRQNDVRAARLSGKKIESSCKQVASYDLEGLSKPFKLFT
jgi:hypothetical protein